VLPELLLDVLPEVAGEGVLHQRPPEQRKRTAENVRPTAAATRPATAIHSAGRLPSRSASPPPSTEPNTIMLRLTDRVVAFIRPMSRSGVIDWR
jgi:hypothetical protein